MRFFSVKFRWLLKKPLEEIVTLSQASWEANGYSCSVKNILRFRGELDNKFDFDI